MKEERKWQTDTPAAPFLSFQCPIIFLSNTHNSGWVVGTPASSQVSNNINSLEFSYSRSKGHRLIQSRRGMGTTIILLQWGGMTYMTSLWISFPLNFLSLYSTLAFSFTLTFSITSYILSSLSPSHLSFSLIFLSVTEYMYEWCKLIIEVRHNV